LLGINSPSRVTISLSGTHVEGDIYSEGDHLALNGTLAGHSITFQFKIGNQRKTYEGTVSAERMSGTFTRAGKGGALAGDWAAQRAPQHNPVSPRTLDFNPSEFHRTLSPDIAPVLRIWPGDAVRTKSVDAGGQDEKSMYRVAG
jgi:amidase